MKKVCVATLILALVCLSEAAELDSKSVLFGAGLGLGIYTTKQFIAIPVAHVTKKAAKKTAHVTMRIVLLGKK